MRHTADEYATSLAHRLFRETQSLIGNSLLTVAQSIEVFQSILVLSLWSTTIGQRPLAVDGWLLTSYAIHQAQVCPIFQEVLRQPLRPRPLEENSHINAWCIWNHLCLAHLQ